MNTGDPLRDYDLYEAMQVKKEMKQPKCCDCDNPIWDEYLWDIGGDLYCEDCAASLFRHSTENYEED